MSQTPHKRDPFSLVATAAAYVPRPVTEKAFARLESAVFEDERIGVIQGPAGFGKTLLLRRLAEAGRGAYSSVYLPYAALSPDELCSWILESLGAKAADDPPTVFRAWLGHLVRQGVPLLLLVDDATALPLESAEWLVQLAKERVLRLVLAGLEGESGAAFRDVLPEDAERIRLAEPMSEEETRDYLSARLDMAEVPESERAAFDREVVENLYEVSQGNPRRLHQAASAVLRGVRPDAIVAFMDGEEPPPEPARLAPAMDDAGLEPLYAEEEPGLEEATAPVAECAVAPHPVEEEPLELGSPSDVTSAEIEDSCEPYTPPEPIGFPEEARPESDPEPIELAEPPESDPEAIELAEPVGPIHALEPEERVSREEREPEATEEPPVVHGEIALVRNVPGHPGSLLLRRTGPRADLARPAAPPIPEASQVLADALGEDDEGLEEDVASEAEAPAAPPEVDDDLPEPARIAARAEQAPEPKPAESREDLEETLRDAGRGLIQATGLLREATVALGVPGTPRGDARAALREAVFALRDAIATADTAVGTVAGPTRQRDPETEPRVLLGALARVGVVIGLSALLGAGSVFLLQGGDTSQPLRAVVAQTPISQSPPLPRLAETPVPAPTPAPEAVAVEAPPGPIAPPLEDLAPAAETFGIGVNAQPWAHVEVDGRDVGMTPIASLELPEGLHIFRARMPDGRIVVRRVEIGPETEPLVFR